MDAISEYEAGGGHDGAARAEAAIAQDERALESCTRHLP
jgi:hypothetical protein